MYAKGTNVNGARRRGSRRAPTSGACLGGGSAAFATGCLVLGSGATLVRLAAPAVGLLPAVLGGARRVGDPGCPLFGHAFVLEGLVLLLVLHVGRLRWHDGPLSSRCQLWPRARAS